MNIEQTRDWMISHQIRPWNVLDEQVLSTLGKVKREEFVPEAYRNLAFADTEIPLPQGQRMLTPMLEGRLLQALELDDDHDVLLVGTGSGYLAACIAALSKHVTAIDCHEQLTNHAQTALALARISNTELLTADFATYAPDRQFDRIVLTGSLPELDPRLPEWLTEGGLLILPIGTAPNMEIEAIRRTGDQYSRTRLFETVVARLENLPETPTFTF
jgi:protein-L-isoaspartate(D-aspartate) O-methyltransferase